MLTVINPLRTCWTRIVRLDYTARFWRIRHRRSETVLAAGVMGKTDSNKSFDLIGVYAAICNAFAIDVGSQRRIRQGKSARGGEQSEEGIDRFHIEDIMLETLL